MFVITIDMDGPVYFLGLIPNAKGASDTAWTTDRTQATVFRSERAARDTAAVYMARVERT